MFPHLKLDYFPMSDLFNNKTRQNHISVIGNTATGFKQRRHYNLSTLLFPLLLLISVTLPPVHSIAITNVVYSSKHARNSGIRKLIDNYINGGVVAQEDSVKYGDITDWDVSLITDMSYAFDGKFTFNADLSKWNVQSVTTFSYTFRNAKLFISDLSQWQTSQVKTFTFMFFGCERFTAELSEWDVSRVSNFGSMFYGANNFNSDLSKWLVLALFFFSFSSPCSFVYPFFLMVLLTDI